MSQKNNFEAAHTSYSQALVALSDPYSFSFTVIRNSTVSDIQALKATIENDNAEPKLHRALEIIREARKIADNLSSSKEDIIQCQDAIQGHMIATPAPGASNDAQSGSEEKSDEEEEWEIIET